MNAGIVQLNKLVEASCAIANVAGKVLEDGKVNMADMAYMFQLFQALQRFADIKFAEINLELKDLSEQELAVLSESFKKAFDLPQDKIEGKIEAGFDVSLQLYKSIIAVIEFAKQLKA